MEQYIYENYPTTEFLEHKIDEGESLGEGVLSRVKGPSFFLDGFSRNGRFYPKKLWENALKNNETKIKLKKGLMFGCIGHPKDYTLDNLLESGKVSHKVTDLYIDKKTGVGMAEYEILDTPSGRILNTILKSGSEMYVSTRAFGGFTNETKEKDGKKYKILDDSNFVIESVDFVIEPGFLDTNPKLVESIKEDLMLLSEDEHNIVCENGVCSLGEDLKKIEEAKIEEVVVADVAEQEVDYSAVLELPKEDIVNMLKNVVQENKILATKNEKDELNELNEPKTNTEPSDDVKQDDEVEVDSKRLMNYLSYLELLIKMVKYNTEFEKYYSDLIEVIDKDDELTVKDMEIVDKITEEILKEEDLDESIEKICVKIRDMYEKINNIEPREDPKKKGDNEEPKKKVEPKEEPEENEEPEEEKEETFVDFVLALKTRVVEKVILKEDVTKIKLQNGQIIRLKEATIALTNQLEASINKEPESIEKIVTEIKYDVPKEVTEKIGQLNGKILELKEGKDDLQKFIVELNKTSELKITEMEVENTTLEEKYGGDIDTLTLENEALEMQITEDNKNASILENNYTSEKESLKEDIKKLEGSHVTLSEKFKDLVTKKDLVISENKKLKVQAFESKAKYLSSVYRLELLTVKKLIETYTNENDLEKALSKEQRLGIKENTLNIELPKYTPNNESLRKSKLLDRLM